MTLASAIPSLQHLVLDHVSWGFYEHVLEEIGDRPIRVTFFRGRIEIMSPLPEHERIKKAIARLLETVAFERGIPMSAFGSTTFRNEDKEAGLEPDECYYLGNEAAVRGMKVFDPSVDPPPDLAVEVDVTHRSTPREPIYAALGVPELWRYDGSNLLVRLLIASRTYKTVPSSPAFPFLPMERLQEFIRRMVSEEQTAVLREFQRWISSL